MNSSESIAQRLVSGGMWATGGKMLVAISGLLLNVLLARLLSPDEVGAYFLVVSIVLVGALVVQLGMHNAVVRLVAEGLEDIEYSPVRRDIRSVFTITAVGAVFVGLSYYLFLGKWLGEDVFDSGLVGSVTGLTAIWIALRALQALTSESLRGFHRIAHASVFEGALTGILVVVALFIIWLQKKESSLDEVLVVTLGALIFSNLVGILILRGQYYQANPSSGLDIKKAMGVGLPLFVASVAVPGIAEAHLWVLGNAVQEAVVAIYGAAYRVARVVVIPLLIINSVIPPMVAQFMAQNKSRDVERILRATAVVAGIPSVFIVLVLAASGTDLLELLFGEYYARGADALLVLVAAQAINALTGSPGVLLMMSGRQSVVMNFALISGVIGIFVSLLTVDTMGYLGVAYGVATGMVINNTGMWAYCFYKMSIRTHMGVGSFIDVFGFICKRIASICK